ncbi:glycoside hydrolase family 10 protein [Pleurocapsa sp. PCC 7319]|uniref:glycoside hydrolase family 10 protein n=1 Tax=Pleurocapsa sp. PCC 7319 TaxID=118161 RepID=UPI0003486D71|nr:family 10 glycosylhydrolase [Pleurocapsa sp. PCC 7319]
MFKNDGHLPQLQPTIDIKIKPISNITLIKKLLELTIIVLPTTILTLPVIAIKSEIASASLSPKSVINDHSSKQRVNYCPSKPVKQNKHVGASFIEQNSTFLGWNWKSAQLVGSTLNKNWLESALNRYSINGINSNDRSSSTKGSFGTNCNFNQIAQKSSRSALDDLLLLQDPSEFRLPSSNFASPDESDLDISAAEIRIMKQELEGLIGRFETTLLTADAYYSDIDISMADVIQQLLSKQTKNYQAKEKSLVKSEYRDAHRALEQARNGLDRFRNLVNQRSYLKAKAEWLAAKQLLWDNYPSDRPVAHSEVRGMWLDRGTIVKAKSEADLVKIFDRMATAGINTVFFETVNSGYTIYPSKVAPKQNPLVEGWDPLKVAIKLAHERGMELHAWVWTFAAVNQRHNTIINLPRNYLGPVLSKHPDWALTDHEGSRFHYSSGKVFLDPANPDVRNYLTSLLTEIATDYDVDGVHLDYIRYPFQSPTGKITYGYGRVAREQFAAQTGIDPIQLDPQHPLWSEWTEFRIEQIDSFVASVSQNLKQLRPDLTLSTAVFPMPYRERTSKIQQNWENWVAKEWIDMLIPMTYAENTEKLYTLASPLLSEFDHGKALLLPGIRLLNISEIGALDQMQLLRGMSTEGYALFAAENLNSHFETIFNSTQGSISSEPRQPLPHREPFLVTLSRYQSLQKEWNFFLTNNQLVIEDITLQEWGENADRLAHDLQKLVDEPSNRNFFSTQISLNSLRRKFPQWMEETKSIDAYQVKVWENRLNTLDRLLSYGENKVLKPAPTTVVR